MKRIFIFLTGIVSAMGMFVSETNAQSKSGNTGMNPVLENIFARKSVRSFENKAVSKDTLELIVKAGMAAPSAMNKQPWEFFVFSGKQEMALLSEKLPYAKMLKEAGAAIIVLGNPEVSKLWYLDCAAAAENILLAVESMGLGAVWTAGYPYDDRMNAIKEALHIPDPYLPLCLIPVGYPKGEQQAKEKWNPAKVHFNEW